MDDIWQRHRKFILWIGAGLGVCLVMLIVFSAGWDRSVPELAAINDDLRKKTREKQVPTPEDTDAVLDAKDRLEARIDYVANKVGVTGGGGDLTEKLVRKILGAIDKENDVTVNRYLDLARRTPKSCIVGLEGDVREHLSNKASLENVVLPESLGFTNMELESTELTRYLITLDLVIHLVDLAIEERLIEVKGILIETPSTGRFKTADAFIADYPVQLAIRGHSLSVLKFVERLNSAERFVPMRQLQKLGRERAERDEDVVTAVMDLMALRIRLGS